MKKIILILVTVVLLISSIPTKSMAHDTVGLLAGEAFNYAINAKTTSLTDNDHETYIHTKLYQSFYTEELGGIEANTLYIDILSLDDDGNGVLGQARIRILNQQGDLLYEHYFNEEGEFYIDFGQTITDINKVYFISTVSGESIKVAEIDLYKSGLDTTPPGEVTDLQHTVNDNDVTLNWTNPSDSDFDSINIYRNGSLLASNVSGSTYADSNLSPGDYEYKLTTVDTSGNESVGVSITVSIDDPDDTIPPGEVTGLTSDIQGQDVVLSWTNPLDPDFANVNIYRDGVLLAESITGTTYTDVGLDPGSYTYTITTVDTAGNESTGQEITVTVEAVQEPQEEVTGLDYTVEGNNVTLTWINPNIAEFEGVKIYRDGEYIGTTTEESFSESLTSGIYQYKVSTVVAGNESTGVIIDVSVQSVPLPVKGVRMVNTTSTGGTITWTPNAEAENIEKYIIYVNGEKHGEAIEPPYILDGLQEGTTYDIAVSAVNAIGEGPMSQIFSFIPSKISDIKNSIKVGEIFSYVSMLFMNVWPLIALALAILFMPKVIQMIKASAS